MEQILPYRNHIIYTEEQAGLLPADQPYLQSVIYADWTDGHNYMMHSHADVAEVLLILNGHGRYSVGTHRYAIQAGDVILCNSGVLHDEFPQTDEPYHTICIGIKRLLLPGLAPNQLISEEREPVFHGPGQFADLSDLFFMIERHAAERRPHFQPFCQHLTLAALDLLTQMTEQSSAARPQKKETLCVKVETYINAHYTEDLSIDLLGKLFYVSPYHLAHVFKEQTGYTIKQYILRHRIGEAQTRLGTTDESVTCIARAVGFEDAGYFSRLFVKYVGMTPTEYREYRTNEKPQDRPGR